MFADFLHSLAIPIGFLIAACVGLFKLARVKDKEISRAVIGVALGVVLGFVADIMKRSYDDFRNTRQLKSASMVLLKNDAKSIYRTLWFYDQLRKSPTGPEELKKQAGPAKLDMNYWNSLKKTNGFLLLASQSPFDEIFRQMYDFEKINQELESGIAGDPNAMRLGTAFFVSAVNEGAHRELLRLFMSDQEIDSEDQKFLKRANERKR